MFARLTNGVGVGVGSCLRGKSVIWYQADWSIGRKSVAVDEWH